MSTDADKIRRNLDRIEHQLAWVTSMLDGQHSRSGDTPVHTSEISDPTHAAYLNAERVRAAAAEQKARHHLRRALVDTRKAYDTLDAILNRPGPEPEDTEPTITPAELAEAQQAQQRRHARGQGHGHG